MAFIALAMAAALTVLLPPLAEAAPLQQPSQEHHARRLAAAQPRSLQQGAQGAQPCAISSNKAGPFWLGAAVTCLEFWPPPGAPIRLPNDTVTTKYGQLVLANWTPVTATFYDRDGKAYPISPSVRVPNDTDVYLKSTPSVIVKATVDPKSGNVTAWSPEVYVPFSTVMATMRDTQFEGTLLNSDPLPATLNQSWWIRFSFSNVVYVEDDNKEKYGTLLMGTLDNLFRSVKDSKGVCRPALCADPTFRSTPCRFYTPHFGNSTNAVTLNWDGDMHGPNDSEVVLLFRQSSRQYMSSNIMQLYQLLKPFHFVPRKHVFSAHGVPMGIPLSFDGTLKRASTRLQHC